jgi:hypothetical protein
VVQVSVCFETNGKRSGKGFYVGMIGNFPDEKLQHAELTAIAFREDYEFCTRNQIDFGGVHVFYKGWQDKELYKLSCEERVRQFAI